MKARLRANHPDTLTAMSNLAAAYQAAGQSDKALPLWEDTLTLQKRELPADHPDTLATMTMLATGYQAAHQFDKARPFLEDLLRANG